MTASCAPKVQSSLLVSVVAPIGLLCAMASLLLVVALSTGRTLDEPAWVHASDEWNKGAESSSTSALKQPPLAYMIDGAVRSALPDVRGESRGGPPSPIARARLSLLPVTLLLAVVAYAWARRWFGPRGGLLTLALVAFDPNLIAHGALFTSDSLYACAFVLAFYSLHLYVESLDIRWAAMLCIVTCLGALAKHTGLVLIPLEAIVGAVLVALQPNEKRRRAARSFAVVWSAAVVCTLVGVNLAYGFAGSFQTMNDFHFKSPSLAAVASRSLVGGIPVPLPAAYVMGLDAQKAVVDVGHPAFLLGSRSVEGFLWFYPLAWTMKTPVGAVVLVGLALWSLWRRPRLGAAAVALLMPAAVFLAYLTFGSRNNAVFRYALAVIPMAYVLVGRLPKVMPTVAVITLVGLSVAESLWRAPSYLAFCNVAVGGPDRGYRYFADSNFDWGQADERAAAFIAARKANGERWEVSPSSPTVGRFLMSANRYNDVLTPERCHEWLRRFEPRSFVGHAYLGFELRLRDFRERSRSPGDSRMAKAEWVAVLVGCGKLIEAEVAARNALSADASDAVLRAALGRVLLAAGRATEARTEMHRATSEQGGRLATRGHLAPETFALHAIAAAESGDVAEARQAARNGWLTAILEQQRVPVRLRSGDDLRDLPVANWPSAIQAELNARGPSETLTNNLGVAFWAAGDLAASRSALEAALRGDPALAETRLSLSVVMDESGDPIAARALAAEAIDAIQVPSSHLHVFVELAEARINLTEFLTIDPRVTAAPAQAWRRRILRKYEVKRQEPSPERDLAIAEEEMFYGNLGESWLCTQRAGAAADATMRARALTTQAEILWRLKLPDAATRRVKAALAAASDFAPARELIDAIEEERRRLADFVD